MLLSEPIVQTEERPKRKLELQLSDVSAVSVMSALSEVTDVSFESQIGNDDRVGLQVIGPPEYVTVA